LATQQPYLNTIGNGWAWVQEEVNKVGCPTFEGFKVAFKAALAKVPQHTIKNLYGSLEGRMKTVIKYEGASTKYYAPLDGLAHRVLHN
jgi:hypothetical protein